MAGEQTYELARLRQRHYLEEKALFCSDAAHDWDQRDLRYEAFKEAADLANYLWKMGQIGLANRAATLGDAILRLKPKESHDV